MSKELVISSNKHETRVALLEDDQLVEVYFQRANEYSLAGSIHKGRVTRVLPGMQSAFVDLGLERDTFLYVSDFLEEEHEDVDRVGDERPPRAERERDRGGRRDRDRDRGRNRDRQPQEAAPAAAEEVPAVEGDAAEVGESTESTEAASAPAAEGARPERGDRGDRGDRRGRGRRRRRGRGFPQDKYASPTAEGTAPAAEEAEDEGPEEIAEGSPEVVSDEEPIILPGESLRKYKAAPVRLFASPEPVAHAEEVAAEPIHETAAEVEPAVIAMPVVEAEPAPEPVVETVSEDVLDAIESVEDAEDALPALAPALDEDEDRDIQEMILSEIEGVGIEEEEVPVEGDGVPGVDSSPAAPEGASAQVREPGKRFEHRMSRRRRRRGDRDRRGPQQQAAPEAEGTEAAVAEVPAAEARPERERPERERPEREKTVARPAQQSISDLLKPGQEIIVQIAKEPLGQKGARITSHIALPGRYVVYMPTIDHTGVSRKISSDEERHRLKKILQGTKPGPVGGFITRTAAEGRTEDEIAADMKFLYDLWQDIKQKADRKPAPILLHHDLDIVQRILRDQLADSFKSIWIDSEELYENVLSFVQRFQPALVGKVKMYTRDTPIFDAFGVTNELEKALRPKVWLKSGGYIVINQTEALVAIDINTGKFVGKSNRLEDTIVKTNTEAIKEIVRQIRLRDLGGIIVIDFIDMDERKNRQKVMQALEEAMKVDRAPYKILQFNDFGLVAITRKRVKQSLERTLCSPCPHCEGAGYVKSVQTIVSEILTEARKMASSVEGKDVMLRVNPDVAKVLKSHQNKYLEELEEILRRPVLVKSDPLIHHEKFDLA